MSDLISENRIHKNVQSNVEFLESSCVYRIRNSLFYLTLYTYLYIMTELTGERFLCIHVYVYSSHVPMV